MQAVLIELWIRLSVMSGYIVLFKEECYGKAGMAGLVDVLLPRSINLRQG